MTLRKSEFLAGLHQCFATAAVGFDEVRVFL